MSGAESKILERLRTVVPDATLERIGPIGDIKPSWSCWIVTSTDQERDRLAADTGFLRELNDIASDEGLAPEAFCVQSEETVARDFEGSWFYAMR